MDRPGDIGELAAFLRDYQNGEQTDHRTVKVIYDCGTDGEQVYELEVSRDFRVITCTRSGYYALFSDPERTEEYEGDGGMDEVTIYAFAEE